MTTFFWIIAGIALVGVTAFSAFTYRSAKTLVRIALERDFVMDTPENEEHKNQMRGFAESAAYKEGLLRGKAYLAGVETESITAEGYDGTRLFARYLPAEKPRRIIIAMHGWRSAWWKDFGLIAKFWHEQNCSILFCDQRAQGNSEGSYMGFGLLERHDCARWVELMHEREPSLPIYLAGISMGGATVLMASSLGIEDRVCGIIADCAFTSPHAIWKHVVESNFHVSYGIIGRVACRICKRTIGYGSRDFSTVDAMKQNKIPVLFVHGESDHFVPMEMTRESYETCQAEKRLLTVPDADHAMSYFVGKKEYEAALLDFFRDFDL